MRQNGFWFYGIIPPIINHQELFTMQHALAVIIVSFNTRDLLHACLASLADCTLPLSIIVVDNASFDGSVQMVRESFPTVAVIETGCNLGFAAANNLGMQQAAEADYLLLLNPDTVVHPGAIEQLVAFLDAHPRVGMVSPRLRNPDGSLQRAAFRFPTLLMSIFEVFPPGAALPGRFYNSWWHGRYPQEAADAPFPIDHPLGACMLVRRAVLAHVGGFDERYFMYSEEVEWCWRIRQAHWAIWQLPTAWVTHVGGGATRQFRRRMLVELHRSRIQFFHQHYRPAFRSAHQLITGLGMLRATLLAWRDYQRNTITSDELRLRLLAYGEVMKIHSRSIRTRYPAKTPAHQDRSTG